MTDPWMPPDGAPLSLTPPLLLDAPVPALVRRKRRLAPIVPTTIALAALTAVGGFAAVNKASRDRAAATSTASSIAKPLTGAAPVESTLTSSKTVSSTAKVLPETVAPSGGGATTAISIARPSAASAPPSASGAPAPAGSAVAPVGPVSSTVSPAPVAQPGVPMAKPLPAAGLYDGGRPPQLVLVSFDGAADQSILDHWLQVSAKAQAHMSFFLSTVYLLSKDARTNYQGPRHNPGESAIGFAQNGAAPVADWLRTTVTGLQDAQRKGHELAMHFGGHWCGANGVRAWNADDWRTDLDQADTLAANVDAFNGLSPAVGSPFLTKPVGARTPCLEGNLGLLEPVLAERGYRYDASKTRNLNEWPRNANGVWQYGFPSIAIEGYKLALLAVDYSINYNMVPNHGEADVKRAAQIEPLVYDGYMNAFDRLYYGNRAPLELSNHFTHMSHDAYNKAVEKFVLTVCVKPEVHCVSYREATDWMDAHKESVAALEKGGFPALARPAAG